jgi:OmpA-OmpF porin, OOP family
MIRKTIFAAVAIGLSAAAAAQDFDNRFYIAPQVNAVFTDSKRDSDNALQLALGIGKFLTPNFSLEGNINRFSSDLQKRSGKQRVTGVDLAGRLFFGEGEGWRPYIMGAIGSERSSRTGANKGSGLGLKAGLGLQNNFTDRVAGRFEGAYNYIKDDNSIVTENDYSDFTAGFGLAIALGDGGAAPMVSDEAKDLGEPKTDMVDAPKEEMAPPPEEAPADPMIKDGDKDGVADDMDKCPTTPEGEMVQKADGCPIKEVIDLRGVNFDFDKCNLRSDAVAILDNAVAVLKGNDIKVSVEGHTDARGTDAYNQKLSECRAKVVTSYLTGHGVSADHIIGTTGFGESKPIDSNDTDEGRANNRRTELVRGKE